MFADRPIRFSARLLPGTQQFVCVRVSGRTDPFQIALLVGPTSIQRDDVVPMKFHRVGIVIGYTLTYFPYIVSCSYFHKTIVVGPRPFVKRQTSFTLSKKSARSFGIGCVDFLGSSTIGSSLRASEGVI